MVNDDVGKARDDARALLEPMGRRWAHVRGVAAVAASLPLPDGLMSSITAAAWLHDVGYAPGVVATGLHALDGARWAERQGWSPLVVSLVAYHSGSMWEAEERGLESSLQEIKPPPTDLLDRLTYADMTTDPAGSRICVESRLSEILRRYGPCHPVYRAVTRSRSALVASVRAVEIATGRPSADVHVPTAESVRDPPTH